MAGGRYHVRIDGAGYLIREGSYRRVAAARGLGGWGWRKWAQADWRRGEGQRVQGEPGRWKAGYGVDAGEAGRLRLGPALVPSYASPEGGFAAMMAFLGRLYAAASTSGKIYAFDGASWVQDWNTGKSAMGCLARHGDRLYAGSGSDGFVYTRDGVGWSTAFEVAGVAGISAMASYELWDAAGKTTVGRLFLGCRMPAGEAKVYVWDGTAAAELRGCGEGRIEAMAVYGGRLFVATSDAGNGLRGRILAFDGRSASGEWEEAASLSDSYVAGWAVFDNLLFCGSGAGGKVWAFDGTRMVEAYDLGGQGAADPGELRALAVCDGRLFVGYEHPTEGTALLCKLSAAAVLDPVMVVAGGGGRAELEACRLGWSTPSATGAPGRAGALGVYGGELFLAGEAAGAATVYKRDPGASRVYGVADMSDLDGGDPATPKHLGRLSLSHERLGPGESVTVSYALDGSEGYQLLEGFDSLAGCDAGATSADWRTGDSLLRLRGNPPLTYEGKVAGSNTVPHVARRLASPNPESPPGAFAEEFATADYGAVAAAGGGVAVATAPAGQYALQLYEIDLAGLALHGLRPRAVAYGRGEASGAPAAGVRFRVWNHRTGAWDCLGSNEAQQADSEAARTIEAEVAGEALSQYVAGGRLYLSLRSACPGGEACGAEVGADFVGLDALWAPEGEAVSSVVALPGGGTVTRARLDVVEWSIPAGCGIEFYLSADGGAHWEAASSGVELVFANPGDALRWRAVLTGPGTSTPAVELLGIDCLGGGWVVLGSSDVEGSTGAVWQFGEGARCRRLGLRVELAGCGGASGPVVRGLELEYAPAAGSRREWGFEVRCEGVPAAGLPLVLLDGSSEMRSGAELSRDLWAARARERVAFEDLDGSEYQAWFEGLEESLGNLPQEHGAQTVAKCRLVEG